MFVARAAGGGVVAMRMYLSSAYTMTSSMTMITPMAADASYPGTVVTGNQLVVNASGTVNITGNVQISANSFSTTETGAIFKNGTQLTSGTTSSTGGIALSSSAVAVNAGDVLDLRCSTGYSGTVAATTTYLLITPV